MATTAASYRTRQITEPAPPVDPGQLLKLSEDLEALCREGILEAFNDEHNVTRYRPIQKECAASAA